MNFDKKMVRAPYVVEVVQITEANIEEINKMIGYTGLDRDADGRPCIIVDKRVVPNIWRAYPGHYLTKVGDKFQVYAPNVFESQFFDYQDIVTFEFDEEGKPQLLNIHGAIIGHRN